MLQLPPLCSNVASMISMYRCHQIGFDSTEYTEDSIQSASNPVCRSNQCNLLIVNERKRHVTNERIMLWLRLFSPKSTISQTYIYPHWTAWNPDLGSPQSRRHVRVTCACASELLARCIVTYSKNWSPTTWRTSRFLTSRRRCIRAVYTIYGICDIRGFAATAEAEWLQLADATDHIYIAVCCLLACVNSALY